MKKKVLLGLLIALVILSVACLPFQILQVKESYSLLNDIDVHSNTNPVYNYWKTTYIKAIINTIAGILIILISLIFAYLVIKRECLLKTSKEEKQEKAERQERRKQKILLQLNAKIEKLNDKNEKSGE